MHSNNPHALPKTALYLGIAALLVAGSADAGENPGAHRHGYGHLQMAVQDDNIDLFFTSPAYNVVGFERQAKTPEEETRMAEISDWLGNNPLIDTVPGSCVVMAGAVHHTGPASQPDDDPHRHDEHHHDSEEEGHREYEVSQQLACKALATGQTFSSPLKVRFPNLEVLTVEWVGGAGQGSIRLGADESTFQLGQ
ncbi:ZrgA family zinc uptake protein [Marinobacter lipolyticus]|uniref:ZrgA family zinc uptake protein n=1 Tax=Marinobacter lipolyticus TaxID=209639 RepID=UPI003A9416E4